MTAGAKTTEAWGGAAVVAILLSAATDSQSVAVQCVCYAGIALVAAAYGISRGLAKRNS